MTVAYRNDPVLLQWCEKLLANGAFEEAEGFAKVLHEANEHPSRLMLARALDANGKAEKASKLLKDFSDEKMGTVGPEMFEVLQLNGKILASLGKLKKSKANLERALTVLPADECFDKVRASTEYQLASLLAALGKFEPAQVIFNKAMPVRCDNAWETSARIVDFFVQDSSSSNEKAWLKNKTLGLSPDLDVNPDAKLIYLVSGDLSYCKKFGPSLVKHIAKVGNSNVHLHIHGISIGSKDLGSQKEAWTALNEELLSMGASVSVSKRHIDSDNFDQNQMKSIYSFERFNILPHILKTYDLPVLVADIDQLPLRDPTGLLDKTFDVALLRFPKGVLNILSVVSATLSVFRPTKDGISAAAQLRDYFKSAIANPAKLSWHVDQAGLAVLDYKNTEAKIHHLNPKLVVTDPTKFDPLEAVDEGAWFWSVTNSIAGNAKELDAYELDTIEIGLSA
ncbi:MAG: tetratricopeptide repeat protein [Hellea sp.]